MRTIANGFATDLPAGWEDRSMTTLVGPRGKGGFAPNVVVTRERLSGARLEEYARTQLEGASAQLPGLQVIGEKRGELGGLASIRRLQRFTTGGKQIQQSQTFALGPDRAVVVTCSAQLEEFDECLPAFEEVLASFRFFDTGSTAW